MNRKFTKLALIALVATILATLVLSSMVFAADFSASMKQTMSSPMGNMSMDGKLYVKGIMQRQDVSTPMGKQIVIIRPDKGTVWVLHPSDKTYMEQSIAKMDPRNPPTVESMLKRMPNFKKIGSEQISGYQCDKYKFADKTRNLSGTVSISPKLKQELKTNVKTSQGSMNLVLSNVKETAQPASLFNLPAGYKKMAMPQMPGGAPGMGGPGGPPPGFGK